MRTLNPSQANRALASLQGGATVRPTVGLRGYPNTATPNVPPFYNENQVFGGGGPGGGPMTRIDPVTGISTPVAAPPLNTSRSFIVPFALNADGAQVLSTNNRRVLLLIQNQDVAFTLYFNLGGGAGVNNGVRLLPGEGFVFDTGCPSDSLSIAYDVLAGSTGFGIALEVQQ